MTSQLDLYQADKNHSLSHDFIEGLQRFERQDYEAAAILFRSAVDSADINDSFQNRYTSFHGLTRVYMGDEHGVKLCRKAATGDTSDAEVYFNLAQAEHRLQQPANAELALRRGLKIDASHPGLQQLQQQLSGRYKRGASSLMQQLLYRLFRHARSVQPGEDSASQ